MCISMFFEILQASVAIFHQEDTRSGMISIISAKNAGAISWLETSIGKQPSRTTALIAAVQ